MRTHALEPGNSRRRQPKPVRSSSIYARPRRPWRSNRRSCPNSSASHSLSVADSRKAASASVSTWVISPRWMRRRNGSTPCATSIPVPGLARHPERSCVSVRPLQPPRSLSRRQLRSRPQTGKPRPRRRTFNHLTSTCRRFMRRHRFLLPCRSRSRHNPDRHHSRSTYHTSMTRPWCIPRDRHRRAYHPRLSALRLLRGPPHQLCGSRPPPCERLSRQREHLPRPRGRLLRRLRPLRPGQLLRLRALPRRWHREPSLRLSPGQLPSRPAHRPRGRHLFSRRPVQQAVPRRTRGHRARRRACRVRTSARF